MIYLLIVVLAAGYLGRGQPSWPRCSAFSVSTSLLSPILSIAIADTEYILTFLVLLGVGLLISTSMARQRAQVVAIRLYEAETNALYTFSRDLAVAEE
jgi:two-component system sensor histidine kinase KdpD